MPFLYFIGLYKIYSSFLTWMNESFQQCKSSTQLCLMVAFVCEVCVCVDVFLCVLNSAAQPRRQIKVEREIPYSSMIRLYLCSVRLLRGHDQRVKKRGVSNSFYGFTTTLSLHLAFIFPSRCCK